MTTKTLLPESKREKTSLSAPISLNSPQMANRVKTATDRVAQERRKAEEAERRRRQEEARMRPRTPVGLD